MYELKRIKRGEWEEIEALCKNSTIYHTWNWMELIEKVFKVDFIATGIFANNELVGILPIYFKKKFIFNLVMSPFHSTATPYGGFATIRDLDFGKLLEGFENFVRRYDPSYIELAHNPIANTKAELVESFGYKTTVKTTTIIDLSKDVEILWQNLDKKCRNSIRKAKKNNLKVREIEEKEDIEIYYEMVKDVYKRQGLKPPLKEVFYQELVSKIPSNSLKILFVELNGEPIAGGIFLIHNGTIYYQDGAFFKKYGHLAPNNLIQWEVIKWGSENREINRYDMLGTGIPSIARFKLSFGGEKVCYLMCSKSLGIFAELSSRIYRESILLKRKILSRFGR